MDGRGPGTLHRVRAETEELVGWLRGAGDPELLAVVRAADLDGPVPEPQPEVVEPYRWFLERIGDGVRLTAAGWLPPALVSEMMRTLRWDEDWFGKGNREDIARPVADLRETARLFGLVRVYRGELRPTTAGRRLREDPVGLWEHLAARVPLTSGDPEEVAGLLWLLGTAAGRRRAEDVVAAGLGRMGYVRSTGAPIDRYTAIGLVRDSTWRVFDRLGLTGGRRGRDAAPSSAAVALARAALLLEIELPPTRSVDAVELTVRLQNVEPPVWRRVVVPASTSLLALHGLLQAAMGWEDSHLHLFEVDGVLYGDVEDLAGDLGDERRTAVADLREGAELRYAYDFGDGWEHTVTVGPRRRAPAPACLDGAGACPPEDVGGAPGYERLLAALADPADEEDVEFVEHYGPVDPSAFDVGEADRRMRRRAARGRR